MEIPGHHVEIVESVPSTNVEARERVAAGQDADGLVLVARRQPQGRGRAGRRWHSVEGALMVTTVHPLPILKRTARLTILSAVAACRALRRLGVDDTTIKWPNDLMRGERKVGGLLAEVVRDPQGRPHLVLGLGINLEIRPGELPGDIAARAGDVGLDTRATTRERLLGTYVEELDLALAELGTEADAARGLEYQRRSWISGRLVSLRWGGRTEAVAVADVTTEGDLVLADGRIAPGEHVQLVRDGESG